MDHSRSPKTARIACPWLLHRFIDHEAEIAFVPPDDVLARASKDPGARDRAGHDQQAEQAVIMQDGHIGWILGPRPV